jgi:hypothetical protein
LETDAPSGHGSRATPLGLMLNPNETLLVGQWELRGGTVVGDATCERIERLVSRHLVEVARSTDGWSTLFQDPSDDRFWERTFPQGDVHGGGPPMLSCISRREADQKYGPLSPSTGRSRGI